MSEHLREEEFIPYLDGRLPAAERTRLEEHFAACAGCRAQLEELRALWGALGEWKPIEPSPGFDAALHTRLAEEKSPRAGWLVLRPAYAAALAVALLAAGIGLWQQMPREVEPAPQATTTPSGQTTPPLAGSDELALLDNPVLLEDYELLEEFDVLFESSPEEDNKL